MAEAPKLPEDHLQANSQPELPLLQDAIVVSQFDEDRRRDFTRQVYDVVRQDPAFPRGFEAVGQLRYGLAEKVQGETRTPLPPQDAAAIARSGVLAAVGLKKRHLDLLDRLDIALERSLQKPPEELPAAQRSSRDRSSAQALERKRAFVERFLRRHREDFSDPFEQQIAALAAFYYPASSRELIHEIYVRLASNGRLPAGMSPKAAEKVIHQTLTVAYMHLALPKR